MVEINAENTSPQVYYSDGISWVIIDGNETSSVVGYEYIYRIMLVH